MHRRSTRGVIRVLGFALIALAAAAPARAQDEQERARQVYQIFKDSCIECHGGEDPKNNLDLRTHASLI